MLHVVIFIQSRRDVRIRDAQCMKGIRMESSSFTRIPPELLQAVLDNPYEGMVIIDRDGIVQHFSKVNESVYGMPADKALGRHIADVVPNSRLHIVARTGKAEIGETLAAGGKQFIVSRYPIRKDGKIIGAVAKAITHNMKAVMVLKEKIRELESRVENYQQGMTDLYPARYAFADIVGESPATLKAKEMAGRLARAESAVVLTGESGTGKELYAHSIHQASPRKGRPFVRINCASIPSELFEAELFGYEPGAYTGAVRSGKPGKFELADKGSIFLDEIAELPLGMQAKLLRALQEKEVERIGARKPKVVDFRVIAATNKDLEERVKEGYFRADLFYRLNVNSIRLPPLRELKEDIPLLVGHFLHKLQKNAGSFISEVDPDVMDAFMNHSWPGNTRELENVIERALNLAAENRITVEQLPESFFKPGSPGSGEESVRPPAALHRMTIDAEREQILAALRKAGGNKSEAAKLLNIHRTTLYYRLRKHRLADG